MYMENMLPLKIKTGIKSLTNNKCNKTTKLEKNIYFLSGFFYILENIYNF